MRTIPFQIWEAARRGFWASISSRKGSNLPPLLLERYLASGKRLRR